MSAKILATLLETGQYNLGRPGKKYYLRYSYTIENEGFAISVDQDRPNKEYALNNLTRILTRKYRLVAGLHFTQFDNDKIIIFNSGYTHLQSQKQQNSKLDYFLETAELFFSLSKKYTNNPNDLAEVEYLLKILLFNDNPFFKTERKNGIIVYMINNKIAELLAEQIRTALFNAINHFIKISGCPFHNTERHLQHAQIRLNINSPQTKNIIMSEQLHTELFNYVIKAQKPYRSNPYGIRTDVEVAQHNNLDYKVIHHEFDQVVVPEQQLHRLKDTIDKYADLIAKHPTVKEQHAYKKVAYKYIVRLFSNMNSIEDTADLFDYLLTLQFKIDVRTNPVIDTLFNIRNTNSWQEMIGEIRDNAILKLQHEVDNTVLSEADTTLARLNHFLSRRLFSKPRSNWFKPSSTRAELDIIIMKRKINQMHSAPSSLNNTFNLY